MTDEMKANVRLEHELLAVESEHTVYVMMELTAPPAPPSGRRPLHLALVVDRSGSMAGEKLAVTRQCASFLVRRLEATDELALVDYDAEVRLLAGRAPVDPRRLLPLIEAIQPGGMTNLSGGWLKGMETLRGAAEDGPRRILLLTDGLANVGVTEPSALVGLASAAAEDGIGTTTIGFGHGFDEELLTAMADAGRGNAHYASTPEEAPKIFDSEFEGLLGVVAQNVNVEVRPSDDVEMVGVLNEYPAVGVQGGVQVQLGDAYGDETRRVILELGVPRLASLGVVKVADLVLRYVSVGEEMRLHEVTMPVVVNAVSAEEAAEAEPDRGVTEEIVVLKAAKAQEEARKRADEGDFEGAQRLLEDAAGDLRRAAPGSAKADELLAQARETEEHRAMMSPAAYDADSRKRIHYSSHVRRRGRPKA